MSKVKDLVTEEQRRECALKYVPHRSNSDISTGWDDELEGIFYTNYCPEDFDLDCEIQRICSSGDCPCNCRVCWNSEALES